MANKQIPTIPTVQKIPRSVSDYKALPTIKWSTEDGGQDVETKTFDAGYDTRWEASTKGSLHETDIWAPNNSRDTFEYAVQEKGESYFIAYFDLNNGRHFRTFTSMGFEFYQSAREKGCIYLYNIGRQYKKPGTEKTWSYAEHARDYDYQGDRGEFFVNTDFHSSEISVQRDNDYVLNRIYFHFKTNPSGSSGTGGAIHSQIEVYNLKLGWGSGEASDKHRICLPKMRAFSEAGRLAFGD